MMSGAMQTVPDTAAYLPPSSAKLKRPQNGSYVLARLGEEEALLKTCWLCSPNDVVTKLTSL